MFHNLVSLKLIILANKPAPPNKPSTTPNPSGPGRGNNPPAPKPAPPPPKKG